MTQLFFLHCNWLTFFHSSSSSFLCSGDDKFMCRSSWTKEQIQASVYASVPPPPVVDVNAYVAPSGGGK